MRMGLWRSTHKCYVCSALFLRLHLVYCHLSVCARARSLTRLLMPSSSCMGVWVWERDGASESGPFVWPWPWQRNHCRTVAASLATLLLCSVCLWVYVRLSVCVCLCACVFGSFFGENLHKNRITLNIHFAKRSAWKRRAPRGMCFLPPSLYLCSSLSGAFDCAFVSWRWVCACVCVVWVVVPRVHLRFVQRAVWSARDGLRKLN